MVIGNTPTFRVKCRINGKEKEVYVKCEWFNITGSIKDRAAQCILTGAIRDKQLKKGMKIVEASSGNMVISLTVIGKVLGYNTVLFIPKTVSKERIDILKLLGAEVYLTNTLEEAIKSAEKYARENNGYYTDQFNNPKNVEAHYDTTGSEIYLLARDCPETVGFCAGVGSGGTLTGVAQVLKNKLGKMLQ